MAGTRNKTPVSKKKGGQKPPFPVYDNLDDLFEPDDEIWTAMIAAGISPGDNPENLHGLLRSGFVSLTLGLGAQDCMKAYFLKLR